MFRKTKIIMTSSGVLQNKKERAFPCSTFSSIQMLLHPLQDSTLKAIVLLVVLTGCVDKSNKQTMNGRSQHTLFIPSENVLVSSKPRCKKISDTKEDTNEEERDREEALEKVFPQRQRGGNPRCMLSSTKGGGGETTTTRIV